MIIAIRDKKMESVDLRFNDVSDKDFWNLWDMCEKNDLILTIYSFERSED